MKTLKMSIASIFVACCLSAAAAAQEWPSKSLKMVIPQSPGGATDFAGRVLAQKLSEVLGQPVIVENRSGAAGNIGTDSVVKSEADGYTILLAALASIAVAPHLYKNLPFDPAKDLIPVTVVANALHVLVVSQSLPVKTVSELIVYAKANPDKLSFGSPGTGEAGHLAGELFKAMTDTKLLNVPYKGGGPAMVGLLGGQVQMIFATVTTALSHINSGTLRAIAMTGGHRFEGLPSIPTFAEAGLPGYEVNNWLGVFLPTGTPSAVVKRLNVALGQALKTDDVKTKFIKSGLEPVWMTPENFADYVKSETIKWGKVVSDAGVKID